MYLNITEIHDLNVQIDKEKEKILSLQKDEFRYKREINASKMSVVGRAVSQNDFTWISVSLATWWLALIHWNLVAATLYGW